MAGGLLQRQGWGGGGGGGGGQRPHFGAGGKNGTTCTCQAIEEVVFEEQAFSISLPVHWGSHYEMLEKHSQLAITHRTSTSDSKHTIEGC